MTVSIRSLDSDRDFQSLVTLLHTVQREPPTNEAVQATLTHPLPLHRLTVVAASDATLIGYCRLTRLASAPAQQATLWIATHPHYRRQGIATALYRDTYTFLQAHHFQELRSQVEEDDPGSLSFAQQHGFHIARHFFRSTLDLQTFDEAPFQASIQIAHAQGIRFTTLAALGDTPEMRHRVYELNKVTAADIPGRGPFFSFDEYEQQRFGQPSYRAEGVIVALKDEEWVGLKQVSLHVDVHRAFDEMTGVLRPYRGHQIAQALKLHAIRYAKAQHMSRLSTFNDAANEPMLRINRKLGYQPEGGRYLLHAEIQNAAHQAAEQEETRAQKS